MCDLISTYSDPKIDEEVKFFDLKVLFILSAILKESRQSLKPHLNILIEYLSFILEQAAENHNKNAELPPIYLNVSIFFTVLVLHCYYMPSYLYLFTYKLVVFV